MKIERRYLVSRRGWARWSKPKNTLGLLRKRLRQHPGPYDITEIDKESGERLGGFRRYNRRGVAKLIKRRGQVGDRFVIEPEGSDEVLQVQVAEKPGWWRRWVLPSGAEEWHPLIRDYYRFMMAKYRRFLLYLGVCNCRPTRQGGSASQHSRWKDGCRACDFRPLNRRGELDQERGDEMFAAAKDQFGNRITIIWRDGGLHEDHGHGQVHPPATGTPVCMGGRD